MSNHYSYRVTWSAEDEEYVATCIEFPSLSWLAPTQDEALRGMTELVHSVIADLEMNNEPIPTPISRREFSGKFNVRIPPTLHRELAETAAEQGVSLNRLVSDRLARH